MMKKWLTKNMNSMPIVLRLPFNHKTLVGYILAMIGKTAALLTLLLCAAPIASFFVGSSWIIAAFIDDTANELPALENFASEKNRCEMEKSLYHIIQQFAEVKELNS